MGSLFGIPQKLLLAAVQLYRLFLSPWLGNACRFEPTCSAYALEALGRHGAAKGSYLAANRLRRCHPWCEGGHDPVPQILPCIKPRQLSCSVSSEKTPS